MMSLSTGLSSWTASENADELWEMTLGDLLRQCAADHPDRVALVDADPDPAVNPANRRMELEHVLRRSRAAGIVHATEHRGVDMTATVREARAAAPELREAISLADWDELLASATEEHELPTVRPEDPAQIQYTSGTTGFPKGALLHHRGVLNASRLVARGAGATDGAVWVNAMPMFHIGGGALTEIGTFSVAGTYVLMPGFDAGHLLELVETYRGTVTLLVPTMLTSVLGHSDLPTRDLSSLETVISGASFVPAALVIRTKETLDCRFAIVFGQTELHGVITQTALDDCPDDQSSTIGRPLPQVDVRIEDTLTAHPAVADVAVVGVPDGHWGEQVGAVVVPADPSTPPTADELRAFCRERITGFKAPSHWYFVDSLPTTPTGKIQKFVLRDRIDSGELDGVVTASSKEKS